jgi:DNA-binding NarL/FixJ family response regulator
MSASPSSPPSGPGDRTAETRGTARLLEEIGMRLIQLGRTDVARLALQLGAVLYDGCGSVADADRVRAKITVPPHDQDHRPDTSTGTCDVEWRQLTVAERRVARAVTDGLSNDEAAQRLFLSRYTVETHLRHIFQKLGLRSRVQLARFVLQHPEVALLT